MLFRSSYGEGHIFSVRGWERADDVGVVGGIDVFKGLAGFGRQPLAADEVGILLACH